MSRNTSIKMAHQVKRRTMMYVLATILVAFMFLFIFFTTSRSPLDITSHYSKGFHEFNRPMLSLNRSIEERTPLRPGKDKTVSLKEEKVTSLSASEEKQVMLSVIAGSGVVLGEGGEYKPTLSTETLSLFKPILMESEKDDFRKALIAFHDAVHLNMTYLLYGGTLLGSYRHHNMIPWDDDLDLLVSQKDKYILRTCLATLNLEFELNTGISHSWKFYHKNSFLTRKGWKWPFLDIFFYNEDNTHIWDINPNLKRIKYKKTDIFPPVERPFMNMMLPAPRNTNFVLSLMFNLNICKSNSYHHKNERWVDKKYIVDVPCDHLRNKFPFVRRVYTSNGTIEALDTVNNGTLSENYTTFILPN